MEETKTGTVTQSPTQSPAQPSIQPPAPDAKPPRSRLKMILLIAGVLIAAVVIWKIFFATPALPENIVALSGRIEGDDSAVAPKTSGKILEITVREGDTVTAGQVIARLDDAQVRAKEDQARAALASAQAK
jgi:HlyD family secretion protein